MVYRIAHCADWHIGYSAGKLQSNNGINLRVVDGYNALDSVVTSIIEHAVDAVVVAGDVFHTPYPTPRDIWFVQKQVRRLAESNIKVYMLAGNHDASDIVSDLAASRLLHDEMRGLFSYVAPYSRVEISDGLFLHMVSHHQHNQQADTFDNITQIPGCVNLFTTHGSVVDPILGMVLSTPQSPREIVIPDFLLDGWDYCLLGHIHERKQVSDKMFYNGSLLRRGFADKECEQGRGWTLVEVSANGQCNISPKRVFERPQIDLSVIDCNALSVDDMNHLLANNIDSLGLNVGDDGLDLVLAPIVRQRFVNANFTNRTGLDNSLVSMVKSKCFSFDTLFTVSQTTQETSENRSDSHDNNTHKNHKSLSLLEQYDLWSVQDSNIKSLVRKHIESGMEKVLNDE